MLGRGALGAVDAVDALGFVSSALCGSGWDFADVSYRIVGVDEGQAALIVWKRRSAK